VVVTTVLLEPASELLLRLRALLVNSALQVRFNLPRALPLCTAPPLLCLHRLDFARLAIIVLPVFLLLRIALLAPIALVQHHRQSLALWAFFAP